MTYEDISKNGQVEVRDDDTREVVARKFKLTTEKKCSLCGEKFGPGDSIEALFPASIDITQVQEEEGPWMPGKLTSKWIRNNAIDVVELKNGLTIHKAPYSKRFLGKSNRAARAHALKSILRRFMGRTLY